MISIKSLSFILAREKQASSDAAADQSLVSVRQSQSSPDRLSGSLSSVKVLASPDFHTVDTSLTAPDQLQQYRLKTL
jgi:hypothetical protein